MEVVKDTRQLIDQQKYNSYKNLTGIVECEQFVSFNRPDVMGSVSEFSETGDIIIINDEDKEYRVGINSPKENINMVSGFEMGRDLWIKIEPELIDFKEIIDSRLAYLNNLKNYVGQSGWIHPGSPTVDSPSLASIETTKDLLKTILNHTRYKLSNEGSGKIPTLVMGPRLDGGFSTEMRFDQNNTVYFDVLNEEKFSISIEEDGHYFDVDTDVNSLSFLVKKYLDIYF